MLDYDYGNKYASGKNFYVARIITSELWESLKFKVDFNDPRNPLLAVDGNSVYHAKTKIQKIDLILNFKNTDVLLYFVWSGKYSTDNFYLPNWDYQKALNLLGYKSDEENLEKLKANLATMELAYKNNYARFQREQKVFEHAKKQFIEAKKDLARRLNLFLEDQEYNYPADRYTETDDNDYWH